MIHRLQCSYQAEQAWRQERENRYDLHGSLLGEQLGYCGHISVPPSLLCIATGMYRIP